MLVPPRQRTLTDHITAQLQEAILSGDLQPGQRLVIRELKERFGVSHIPIREAIRRLETDGLVCSVPQRGAVVAGVSLGELQEVYDLRRLLEVQVSRQALAQASAERVDALTASLQEMDSALEAGDFETFTLENRQFHRIMLEPALTPVTARILRLLWQASDRYVQLGLSVANTGQRGQEEHRRMLAAYRAGDDAALAAETERHLASTEKAVRAHLHVD
jgi:DNA-binding GntR family transcriptional regulator